MQRDKNNSMNRNMIDDGLEKETKKKDWNQKRSQSDFSLLGN